MQEKWIGDVFMKNSRVILSFLLVICILSNCIIPVFADEFDSANEKYSNKVIEFLNNETKNCSSSDINTSTIDEADNKDRLPVYIWYEDINQDLVNKKTKEVTGLTAEECSIIESYSKMKNNILSNNDKKALEKYIKATDETRKEEKEKVEKYILARRKIASEMYAEKSKRLIKGISIDNKNIDFKSKLAPLIIADLTAEEIKKANNIDCTEIIGYYEETECVEDTINSAISISNVDEINANTLLNLTGAEVKVGLIEGNRVSFYEELQGTELYGQYGIIPNNNTPISYNMSNGVNMKDYGNVVVVGNSQRCPITKDKQGHDIVPHVDSTYKVLSSVAPNIQLYTSDTRYECVEAMVLDGVEILSLSMSWLIKEDADDYTYTLRERWTDHLVASHGVTMLKSASNTGDNISDGYHINDQGEQEFHYGPRVQSPGLAYNIISVGAYKEHSQENNHLAYDKLRSYSSYKNNIVDGNNIEHYGCEKPDVVSPSSFYCSGTSAATPFLAGIVALMYELKPTLSLFPQETKAIVLASCQRKVKQTNDQGGPENMDSGIPDRQISGSESGITERQGAGAPDAWNMACIICQGSYGSAIINGTTSSINIEQPPYGASNMNISISCIKENIPVNGHNEANITEGITNDLDLTICQNNTVIKKSALLVSSTELCYVPLSSSNFKYRLTVNQHATPNTTRFGYAWCTDNMRIAPKPTDSNVFTEGIYYIKNKLNERYAIYNLSAQNNNEKAKLGYTSTTNQNNYSDVYKWVVKPTGNKYNIETGYGYEEKYLGIGTETSNNIFSSKVSTVADSLVIKKDEKGYYTIYNSSENKILSFDSSKKLIWKPYSSNQTISGSEQWYFEKANYIRGDANADGNISTDDITYVQQYIANIISINNIERYLADANRDGAISIGDATKINSLINNTHIY